jgi:hypothetical protein
MEELESKSPEEPDRRETAEPPEGGQNREREGPGVEDPATPPEPAPPAPAEEKDEDEQVDRDAEETFPASDPPAHY